jgi:PD-(D/E)XK nuclease superfamily
MSEIQEAQIILKKSKTNILFDSTILNTLQMCAAKTKFEFEMNLRTLQKAEPLEKGDLLHKILEHYYLQHKEIGARLVLETDLFNKAKQEALEFGERHSMTLSLEQSVIQETMKQTEIYLDHTRMDGWEILAVEEPFIVRLYDDEDITVNLAGKIDLIINEPQLGSCVADHKSGSRQETPLRLSNQFTAYSYATDIPIVIVNKIGFQKTVPTEQRMRRYPIRYTEYLINKWKANTVWWAQQYAFFLENDTWPENRTSCDKYGGCIYQSICDAGTLEGRDAMIQNRFVVSEPWDVSSFLEKKKDNGSN